MKILETDRLWLRTWDAEADLDRACSLWCDAEVMTFLGGPLSREKAREKLQLEIGYQLKHGIQYWPIFEKHSDEFVGCCGLKPWIHSPRGGHETGFHIVKAKWGRGYAYEAARRVVKHGFEDLGFPVLRAGHHPDHMNSRKILVKLGFRFVDEVFYKPTGLMHPTYELLNPTSIEDSSSI